jgi:hypothetical protein
MGSAPVCNIAVKPPPGSPNLPGLQPIPKATDLASALKAIAALTSNFNALQSGLTKPKSSANPSSGGGFNTQGNNFVEERPLRVTQTVRIYNPQDNTQYVDVQQITGLVFKDSTSGQLLTFER